MSFLDKILESSDVDEKAVSDMQQSLQSDLFTSQVWYHAIVFVGSQLADQHMLSSLALTR